MNHIIFKAESGKSIDFRLENGLIIAHIENLTNHGASIVMTQAWQQIGESVGGVSFAGRSLTIRGYVKSDAARKKMLDILIPGIRGMLIFEEKYAIDCYVYDSPTIAQEKMGQFTFRLYAPYPWWRGIDEKVIMLGIITPNFSFPVNYAIPHKFGTVDRSGYINVINEGTLPCSYELEIKGNEPIKNPSMINMYTLGKIAFDIEIPTGSTLRMKREEGNISIMMEDPSGDREDVFASLSYDSDMFELNVGDNVLQPIADEGGDGMQIIIKYSEVYAGVSNDMQSVR